MPDQLAHDFQFYLDNPLLQGDFKKYRKRLSTLSCGVLLFHGGGTNDVKNVQMSQQVLDSTRATNVLPGVELSLSHVFKEPEYLKGLPLLHCHAVNLYSSPANYLFKLKEGLKKTRKVFVLMHPFHKDLQKDVPVPDKFLIEFDRIMKDRDIIPVFSEKHLRRNNTTLKYFQFMLSRFNSFLVGSGTNRISRIGCYPKLLWALKKLNSFWNLEDCALFLNRKARLGYEDCLHRLNSFEK